VLAVQSDVPVNFSLNVIDVVSIDDIVRYCSAPAPPTLILSPTTRRPVPPPPVDSSCPVVAVLAPAVTVMEPVEVSV